MDGRVDPTPYLSRLERRLLGWVVRSTFALGGVRFERALRSNGPAATARMACVNAQRAAAIVAFVLGLVVRVAVSDAASYPLLALALIAMLWSFASLFAADRAEREFKRANAEADGPSGLAAFAAQRRT